MNTERAKRKLSAILSADVKGYSRLMGEDEVGTVRTLKEYRELMSRLIKEYRGRVVDSPGDNVLAEFGSVVDALECSIEIQKILKRKNAVLPNNRKMEFRIGVNLGDVIEDEERVYGDGVNIAARIEGLAEPGGICISGSGFEQVRNKLPLGYQYLGEHTVKNIVQPIKVYRVLMEPESAGKVFGEKGRKGKQWRWASAAAVVVVAGALALWNFSFRPPPIEPASKAKMAFPLPDKPSIAVLPFANMSDDPKQDFFSDGITENIITGLSQIRALFVIARNSSFTYKGKPVKVQQVAENLGVRYVLEGSVKKSGNSLRITAQFIDALKGHHIWSERYDRELKDVFAIEDDITKKIITALQVVLTQGEQARLLAKGTENLDAYLKCMEAREYVQLFNKDANLLARQRAEEAIALDSSYSSAHAMLGGTYITAAFFGWSASPKEALEKAFESAKKALSLDESDYKAHGVLATVHLLRREHDAAVEEGERAVSLAPNAADAAWNLGIILRFAGMAKDAIPMFERAIRLNPIRPATSLYQLALSYTFVGEFEKAIDICKEALSKNPDDLTGRVTLIIAYGSLGREDDARAQASELLRIDPKFSLDQAVKTWPYKKQADRDFVLAALRKAGLPDKPSLPVPDKPSIAVLPFVNMSEDKSQEYFSDGLTEEIITALSKTPKLFVIARNSTFVYKGKPVNVQQVSRELGVKYVLEGSVRRSGDQLRITAQLIDATTGKHLWAERYDRELKDVFAIQDEITMNITAAMQVKLTEGEQALLRTKGTKNLDAFFRFLEGWEASRDWNKESHAKARKLAEETIALDPEYQMGHFLLATVEVHDIFLGLSKSPKETLLRAIEMAKRSIAIEDSSFPHQVLAVCYNLLRKHEEAIAEAQKAVEISPNYADGYMILGHVLWFSDMAEKAVPVLQKAIRLNPYPPSQYFHNLAFAFHQLERYEEAIAEAKKAIQVSSEDTVAYRALISSYALLGRLDAARSATAEYLKIDPDFSVDDWAKRTPLKNKAKLEQIGTSFRMAGLK